jgi:hypothetical protein
MVYSIIHKMFSFNNYNICNNSIFVVVSSIFQGGVCGLAGKFPGGYVNAVISGQALGDRQLEHL